MAHAGRQAIDHYGLLITINVVGCVGGDFSQTVVSQQMNYTVTQSAGIMLLATL